MGLLQSYSVYVRDFVFIFGNTLSMFSTGLLIVLWFKYEARGKDKSKSIISHRPTQTRLRQGYGAASKSKSLTELTEITEIVSPPASLETQSPQSFY